MTASARRTEQEARDPAEAEHRHEDHADTQQRDCRGHDDLPRAVHDGVPDGFAFLEMVVDVLDRDRRVVDQDATASARPPSVMTLMVSPIAEENGDREQYRQGN